MDLAIKTKVKIGVQRELYQHTVPAIDLDPNATSSRDIPSTDSDIETPATTSPVPKKPRNNSRLSDPTPRSVEVV